MSRWLPLASTLALTAMLGACVDPGTTTAAPEAELDLPTAFAQAETGNGMPSGEHYNLNIIGVSRDKTAPMDDNTGHRIFVRLYGGQKVCVTDEDWAQYQSITGGEPVENPYSCTPEEWEDALYGGRGKSTGGWDDLDKKNKILLTPNSATDGIEGFQVLDANATDRDGAEFTMPDDVATTYRVYARALGKPGGKSSMTLCANETDVTSDLDDGSGTETWCSINQVVSFRDKGQPKAEDVTETLFTMSILFDLADAVDNEDPLLDGKDEQLAICLATASLIDLEGDATQVADVPIFHGCFQDYFWNYDNNGLKLLQLRFYPVID